MNGPRMNGSGANEGSTGGNRSWRRPGPVRGQRGVALITVLLVVVIATLLGTSMSTAQNLAIHRARNYLDQAQVRQYVGGGEELARQILFEDFAETPTKDHLLEVWASQELNYEYEDGEISLRIIDLQSRFNLNNLMIGGLQRERFTRLLSQLGVDAVFVDRIADWSDADQNTSNLGAEDYEYLGLERPYRTADQGFQDVSELRMVLDMDTESFARLEPYVPALPTTNVPLNVNTADFVMLQVLAPQINGEAVANALEQRVAVEGFNAVPELFAAMGTPPRTSTEGLGVQSGFFEINVTARYQDRFGYLRSVVQRNPADGGLRVLSRTFTRALPPLTTDVEQDAEDE